ncbi:MAG: acyclic terpene utilization AtuA family protein [Sphingomonadaceae bacterium]
MTLDKVVRIGGGSAFFIDSALAVPQLLEAGVDYIILDYLAEGAMGLLGRMKLADPGSGFPSDFLDVHIGPFLQQIAQKGIRIVSNAGGVNPAGLAARLRERISELGLGLTVGCLEGDCLMHRIGDFAGTHDMFNGQPFPEKGITSANAYLGAFPIAQMFESGADIVITGRVVDSALALGPLIKEFGWGPADLDQLAGGTLAGHLIECGAQVTGGTYTDWRDVHGWEDIGAPIAECFGDGSCIITKPEGSGGLVSIGTVAEQLLYETGDPKAYIVPDVTCDFSTATIKDVAKDRVLVANATGLAPPDLLKACATWDDGWRAIAYQPVIGPCAEEKARKQAHALFERGRSMLRKRNLADWRRTECVLIGGAEEVVAKLVVEHDEMLACQMFAREQFAAISSMAPGTSVAFGVQVQPCMNLISFLVAREDVVARMDVGNGFQPFVQPPVCTDENPAHVSSRRLPGRDASLPNIVAEKLVAGSNPTIAELAYVRSGEKGEMINIGVIARSPEFLPILRSALSPKALRDHLSDLGNFEVTIYELPGIHALNIVLAGALPGGLNASQRLDPAAKSIGQRLTSLRVPL